MTEIKEEEPKTDELQTLIKDVTVKYNESGFLQFRMACDSQNIMRINQEISEINKKIQQLKGENSGEKTEGS